jgi:DNA (cytosine-5)-methyltransferase 1
LSELPEEEVPLPSFPIWGDEIDATYPFEDYAPYVAPIEELEQCLNGRVPKIPLTRLELLQLLPNYARVKKSRFPKWKIDFIRQNREWFKNFHRFFSKKWVESLRRFPPSLRKLEWNCKGEERNLWKHVLQFRPSGLRVKRYSASPSLVAMTSTQIPILGPERRFLTRVEGLRLQGFPDNHNLPRSRTKAFKALGNAVHVGVALAIAKQMLKD